MSFAAKIRQVHTFHLPQYASDIVTFFPRGEVLLSDDSHLYRYHYTPGEQYSLTGKTTLPSSVWRHCRKAVTDNYIYIQNDTNALTYQLESTDLSTIKTIHFEGLLRGCVHPGSLTYGLERSKHDSVINVHVEDGKRKITLQPSESRKWDRALSACRAGPYIAVTEWDTQSLDIFSLTGNTSHCVLHAHDCN